MNELAPINEKEVSLFNLKSELVQLMQLREDPELLPEEREAIEGQIKAYVGAELRKVDNVRSYWRHCEVMAEAAREEGKRLLGLASNWEMRLDKLKGLCLELMQGFGEKKLEGRHGFIRRQANGGNVGLEIYNPSLIPENMCQYVGSITSPAWRRIVTLCEALGEDITEFEGVLLERIPKEAMVRAAMKGPCERCGGLGVVGSSETPTRQMECDICHGTKTRVIPGAKLGERGEHVRCQ
jgi:hypothetical protein